MKTPTLQKPAIYEKRLKGSTYKLMILLSLASDDERNKEILRWKIVERMGQTVSLGAPIDHIGS